MVIVMAYKDNRNWAIYNEWSVRRAVLLRFGVSWWDRELKKMNREKRGRPFLHYGIPSSTLFYPRTDRGYGWENY